MKKWQKSSGEEEEEGEGTGEQIGIEMNVVSRDKVESMGSMEKLRFILDGYSGAGRWTDSRGADETDRTHDDGGG